jgi:hypothetical protein
LLEQLVEGDAEKIGRKMIELAKQGNVRCLEFCFDRLLPKRSGRPVDFDLPAIKNVRDLVSAIGKVTTAVNNGQLTAEEAVHMIHLFEGYGRIFTFHDFEVRLQALEMQRKESGDDAGIAQKVTKVGMRQTT